MQQHDSNLRPSVREQFTDNHDLTTLARRLEALERENAALRKRNTGKATRKACPMPSQPKQAKPTQADSGISGLTLVALILLAVFVALWLLPVGTPVGGGQ